MGLLENIGGLITGDERLRHLAGEKADFTSNDTQDYEFLVQMIDDATPEYLESVMINVGREMTGQAYLDHIFKGYRGATPLSHLRRGSLELIAGSLLVGLLDSGMDESVLMAKLPAIRSMDPNEMTPQEVAALACFTRQFRAEVFGHAAAEIARKMPHILHALLGSNGLALAAKGLAAQYCNNTRAA